MRFAALAVVALLLAAACSGGTGDDGNDDAAAPTTTSTPWRMRGPVVLPCPSPVPDPAVVTRFRDDRGRCLPMGQASIHRCSAASTVPTAIVAGRRYLGGPNVVPIAVDPTAAVVGRSGDGAALITVAADPGAVRLARRDGVVERWPEEWALRPQVFVVGDSVILGAQNELAAAFAAMGWAFTMDAEVNRSTPAGLEVLRARRGEVADVVVVGLGYNDGGDVPAWTAAATQLTDELLGSSVRLVVWLTLREARGYYAEDNAALAQLAATRPGVALADWRSTSIAIPATEFSGDGLHLHPTAAQAMAGLVTTTVQGWAATHPDRGDQSCRPAVDALVASGR